MMPYNKTTLLACRADLDATTNGDTTGINVLILTEDLESWESAAEQLGCNCWAAHGEIEAGTFGDSNETIQFASDGEDFYWILEGYNAAAVLGAQGCAPRLQLNAKPPPKMEKKVDDRKRRPNSAEGADIDDALLVNLNCGRLDA